MDLVSLRRLWLTEGAMGAITRTYLALREDLDRLTACPAEAPSAASPQPSERDAGSEE